MDSTDQKQSAAWSEQDEPHRPPIPIAIVGMGFRGPGDASNVEKLWNMILEGREAWSRIPESKWNHSAFYHPDYARHGTTNVQGGHFLAEDVSLFDAPFFNMTSDEAAAMDPQQRLLLEVTYEGFENAGIPLHKVTGSQTACFVGCFNADYADLLLRDPERIPIYQCTNAGQSRAMTANRISYFFDMKGPSVTIDTACSGSLVALHLACSSLQNGDASMAVAAGVNLILSHEFMSTLSMMKFLSPDGRCHTFDEKANGYARGEGIGCVILKPLSDALRDNDPIRAIIRASGSNQDGRTPGITLPSGAAQEALIRSVYKRAGLSPLHTEFVETHGTGTQAGDPTETGALGRVFAENRDPNKPLRIGSIKTNIGHLEGTSGIAAVVKATLMLENRVFLPNRNFERLNGRILLDEWKLKVQLCPEPWESPGPRRVSVNSFGYGGSNAHVIMEEASSRSKRRASDDKDKTCSTPRDRIYMLSGFDEVSIADQISNLQDYLARKSSSIDDEYLNNLAFTLNERRTHHRYRTAVNGNSAERLAAALKNHPKLQTASRRPRIGFVFTGQGAQWCGMGKELLDVYPVFRQSIDRIDRHLQSLGAPFCTVDELKSGSDPTALNHPLLSQPICSAVQIALVDLLASWGIRPDSVTGHSSGEIAAAYAFGALSMEDAMAVAYYRGVVASKLVSDDTPHPGAMLAVGMSPDETQQHVNQLTTGKAVIACINSPSNVTVSGDAAAIDKLQDRLHDRVFTRRLAVKVAYHSHHMESVADEYAKLIAHITHGHNNIMINDNPQGHVSFFSSVNGAEVEASDLGPEYWARNLVSPVRFTDALRALCFMNPDGKRARRSGTARKARINILVEIGPHAALSGPIKQTIEDDTRLKAAEIVYSSVLIRKSHAVTTALSTAATLACAGHPVNFQAINNPSPLRPVRVLVDLPPYAWNHTRSYWAEPRLSKAFRERKYPRTDLLGAPDTSSCPFDPRWRNIVRLSELPWLQDHRIQSSIVYPAAAYIAMVIEAMVQLTSEAAESESRGSVVLEDVSIKSALIIPEHSAVETMTSFRPWDSNSQSEPRYEFHIYSATDDNKWTEHCTGLVGFRHVADEMDTPSTGADPELSALNVKQFYERMSSIGLEYGPCFSNISSAQFADNMCMAKVSVPDTAAVMPMGFEYPCIIHPCTLDSIIQTVFAGMDAISSPAVPVHIDELTVSRSITSTAGNRLDVRTLIHRRRKDAITASIHVKRQDGTAGIAIKNLRCKRLDVDRPAGGIKTQNRIAYDLEWKIDPDLLLPNGLSKLFKRKSAPAGRSESDGLLDACALHYIRRFVDEVNQLHGNVDLRRAQLKYFQRVVQNHRQAENPEADVTAARNSGPQGALLAVMGEGLLSTLKADTSPEYVEASTTWEDYWKVVHEDPINDDLMKYLDLVCHKNPMVTILELEAGAGGAFQRFLKRYPEGSLPCSRYVATHHSSSFVERWTPRYPKLGPVLEFKQLDIEKDSDMQELGKQRFDVVIGLNGLYTVNSKHVALRNIHTLLKEDGKLLLIDPVSNSTPTNAVIFSDYPGQWSEGRFGHLESDWKAGLFQAQFPPHSHLSRLGDRLMLVAQKHTEPATRSADILIIVDGHCAVCLVRLQELFLSSSSTVEVTDLRHAEPAGKLTIVLSDLTQAVLAQPDEKTWNITKDIFLKSSGVLWVTRGGAPSPINPDTGLVTGFARTARSESGVQPIVTLDLDGRTPLCEEMAARMIYDLVQHRFLRKSSNLDTEYSERNGLLLIPRVIENTDLNDALGFRNSQTSQIEPFHQPGRPLRAVLENHDTLRVLFEEISQTTPLADCDVRIEVHAASVSKSSLDMANGSAKNVPLLVDACSGLVVATGTGVRGLRSGDRVLCLASGPLESSYQGKVTAFHKISSEIGMEAAVPLPTAYCAAYHVVHNIAHIRPGQKVLIYSLATAFAQAVIEMCHRSKAQVFTIVNTAAEKSFLLSASLIQNECILDDSDITLRAISALTKGEVDVVIDFAHSRDQHLTDLVRPYGQFIQVQNQTFEGRSRQQMPRLREDISFTTFDFDHFRRTRPDKIEDIFTRFGSLLRDGSLHVPPLSAYPISKASEALQKLESDSGSDSVIIAATSKDSVQVIHKSDSRLLRPDASYMLVGGLGGIGRAIALWMADHRAKTLVLVSRSGLLDKNAMSTVEMLERKGVEVIVRACDVSNSDQVSCMVSELRDRPPIRGVVQAAMVLKDTHIEKMTLENYESVLRPKYNGTWNLHRYLPSDLDWFIMLSSISGIIGNATQAAYAAGSTFMDTFAAYRRSLGLPAVSLDLGVITDSGYLSENTGLASKMAGQGFQGTDTRTLMSLIEATITHQDSETVKPQIITGLGEWKEDQSLANFDASLFSHFRWRVLDENTALQTGSSFTSIRSELQAAKTFNEATSIVYAALSKKVAANMSISVDSISPSNPTSEYGIDSHFAVELRNWIAKNVDRTVPILEILASASLLDLAGKIVGKSDVVHVE
ncbi:polyketide synthase [Aspergillus terreus]|uniref:Polyketide synthase n=1 Tax=Aspergillus terreus TaxID=33178 RepID=A0A5M3YQM4_ASPTE|nr:hypothetical protein ATETN484_0002044400 [Aspergillus terreus]GFF15300.1 polyketide synthase [Aspergillus terreus]